MFLNYPPFNPLWLWCVLKCHQDRECFSVVFLDSDLQLSLIYFFSEQKGSETEILVIHDDCFVSFFIQRTKKMTPVCCAIRSLLKNLIMWTHPLLLSPPKGLWQVKFQLAAGVKLKSAISVRTPVVLALLCDCTTVQCRQSAGSALGFLQTGTIPVSRVEVEGGAACRSALLPLFGFNLQPHTFFSLFFEVCNIWSCRCVAVCVVRCGEWALQRDHADGYSASSLFCPAALCPLCLPRTGANVCLLATSSSCKLEGSPGPDTKGEQTGRQVSSRSCEERKDICSTGFHARSIQRTVFYCSKYTACKWSNCEEVV